MHWFTSDEHYHHAKIIEYCNRPFGHVVEMKEELISRHNSLVDMNDVVVHAGDFCWGKKEQARSIIKRLNGNHVFLKGSHDSWLPDSAKDMWRKTVEGHFIVVCHYCMRVWERSHYNSWMLFGHSHGTLEAIGKSYDIGVDNNNFYPVSFENLETIMLKKPNNLNYVGRE